LAAAAGFGRIADIRVLHDPRTSADGSGGERERDRVASYPRTISQPRRAAVGRIQTGRAGRRFRSGVSSVSVRCEPRATRAAQWRRQDTSLPSKRPARDHSRRRRRPLGDGADWR
jgi:hypothetical protein